MSRKVENENSRVLTKHELLVLHSTLVSLRQENKAFKDKKESIKQVVEETINSLQSKVA